MSDIERKYRQIDRPPNRLAEARGIRDVASSTQIEPHQYKRRYLELFNQMNEGVAQCRIITDNEGNPIDFKYLSVNPAFKDMFPGHENIVGKKLSELSPGLAERIPEHVEVCGRVALEGGQKTLEIRMGPKWLKIKVFSNGDKNFVTIFEDITIEKQRQAELEEKVTRDSLTGLFSRHYFIERYNIYNHPDRGTNVAFIMMDINCLKETNDTHGHQNGDKYLIEVAKVIGSVFRPEDCVARYGGDEVIAFLPRLDQFSCQNLIARLTLALEEAGLKDCVAFGCAIAAVGGDLQQAIKEADKKMYQRKQLQKGEDGKNIPTILKRVVDKINL